uniref:ATP-binding cassette domain-containing protein n=1 Tax=Phenylobacterium glaciei TaxID=2803784 RepID=A0A974S8I6_9CAUL|nr:ATP-binding cassette domain-containing protein [Phenylobacterium glaciei]
MTIGDSIAEPLQVFKPELKRAERDTEVAAMMAKVGLLPALINRYPHELSGGQNQRVGIARAMILKPKLVICDEAVSALDVSIRAQIIDLLIQLQKEMGLAMIFISHDLAVVREISHRVMVLYLGRVMEQAEREQLYAHPHHPYTKALLSAAPIPDPVRERSRKRLKLVGSRRAPWTRAAPCASCPRACRPTPGPGLCARAEGGRPGHLVSEFDPPSEAA